MSAVQIIQPLPGGDVIPAIICHSCAHHLQPQQHQGGEGVSDWFGLPAGVKFDPTDEEIVEHLEAKVKNVTQKIHPLIDKFIPTLEEDDGICYTHPQRLPGMKKDGKIRHFFHRPSKAYTSGTRKRRKIHTDEDGDIETRWHKTGKTRPIFCGGVIKGFKKILVLYTDYGRRRKPQKTNWIMHQYHLGISELEKDGELVASKVFFQTQPRHCTTIHNLNEDSEDRTLQNESAGMISYQNPTSFSCGESSSRSVVSNLQRIEGDASYL